ncbi:hypothetical protein F2P81_018107 [Scophthalmus maximus]|uniref:Uncharacterized protein n=1 Tax=Scophthalmus maximus TaxID=52904 RepID=A0A6A4SEQ0_SCOMX|nr:hypothetical protein F2P81_018107 [Scophthalmus maximus]
MNWSAEAVHSKGERKKEKSSPIPSSIGLLGTLTVDDDRVLTSVTNDGGGFCDVSLDVQVRSSCKDA